MIASLPMYDRPEVQAANDRYWQAIRDALQDGPQTLTRTGDLWDHWLSPDLVLSQTCGYPYRARLHGKVTLVGTPDYGLEGCPPGHYRSVFVARASDRRDTPSQFGDAIFAYNEPLSQSGWAAPGIWAREHGLAFTNTLQTGGHSLSAQAVAEGRADLAALDALSWQMMQTYDPFADDLKVIAATNPTPVLPYITAMGRDPEPVSKAIEAAIASLSQTDRNQLSLKGLLRIPAEAYLSVPSPAPPPA